MNPQQAGDRRGAMYFRTACAAVVAAGLVLSAPTAAHPGHKSKPKSAKATAPAEEVVPTAKSDMAARLTDWIAQSDDNGKFPYIIIDKQAARLFLFDADGNELGDAPVLIGIAVGDNASPGVGAKKLAEIGPAEKTTPAGRFIAKFGRAVGKERVLWVDYHNSVALHAVVTSNKKEHRLERLRTDTVDDNRISFGCINVPTAFYGKKVRPLFQKAGGVVYILPDTKPVEEVFPFVRLLPYMHKAAHNDQATASAQG